MNPYAQFVNPKESEANGNPYKAFIAGPTVDETEQDVIARVNNPNQESPEHLGFQEIKGDPFLRPIRKAIVDVRNNAFRSIAVEPVKAVGTQLVKAGELAKEAGGDPIAAAKASAARRSYEMMKSGRVPSMPELVADYFGIASDVAISLLGSGESTPDTLISAGEAVRGGADEFIKEYNLASDGSFSADVGGAFGSIVQSVALSKFTGSAAPSAALFFTLQDSAIYQEARAKGVAPQDAASMAFKSGAANGVIEYVGGKYFLGAMQQSPLIRRIIMRSVGQGAEEGAQQGAEETIASDIRDTSPEQKLQSVGYVALLGILAGAPVSTIVSAAEQQGEVSGVGKEKAQEIVDNLLKNKTEVEDAAARILYNEASGIAKSQADIDEAKELRAEILKEPDPEALTPEEVDYLNNFLSEEEKALAEKAGVQLKKEPLFEPMPEKPLGLADWVRRQGGLQDTGGDVRSVLGGAKYRPGLINNSGKQIDDLALRAWEEGYFIGDRPTVNDFLDKLTEDLKGNPQYNRRGFSDSIVYNEALTYNAEVDRLAQTLEIETKGKSRQQFWEEVAQKKSLEEWEAEIIERDEAARADIEYYERKAQEFMERRGDAWEPESVQQLTLEELENEWRQAAQAIAGDMDAGQGGAGESGLAGGNTPGLQGSQGQGRGGAKLAGRAGEKARVGLYTEVVRQAKRKGGIGGRAVDVAKDLGDMLESALAPISTRLKNINPKLKSRLRKHEFDLRQQINKDQEAVQPFLEKFTALPQEARAILDFAMKNGDARTIDEMAAAYDMQTEVDAVRKTLDAIYKRGESIGLQISYRKNYFPRYVERPEKLIAYFRGTEEWGQISEAIRLKEEELGPLSVEDKAELINTVLRGYGKSQLALAKPGNLKNRRIDTITPEIMNFYAGTDQAVLRYITVVNTNIESRRFFGKSAAAVDKIEDSIGHFVLQELAQGNIKPSQQDELTRILQARFKQGRIGAFWRTYKNVEYISTMGSPVSAITQVGDLAMSFYKNGVFRTLRVLPKSIAGKSDVTREDIGVQQIAEEFTDAGTTAKAVRGVFKAVGLDKMDAVGKETLINSSLLRLRAQAKKPTAAFRESLEVILGDETDATLADLKQGRISENVKLLLFNELLDIQPVALSEMPEAYLRMGNGRVLYMLKTFTVKQLDIYRNEVFSQIRTNPVKGLSNLTRLAAFMVLMNAGADYLKDLLLGRETEPEDLLINNLFRLVGVSKFQIYTAEREGLGSAMGKTILPPFSVLDRGYKDFNKLVEDGTIDPNELESLQGVPIAGKIYYWWYGNGAEK